VAISTVLPIQAKEIPEAVLPEHGRAAASSNSAMREANSRAEIDSQFAKEDISNWRRLSSLASTVGRLGAGNVARVAIHRCFKHAGIYRVLSPRSARLPAFALDVAGHRAAAVTFHFDRSVLLEADELLEGTASYFSAHRFQVGNPPDWFLNPFQNTRDQRSDRHWSEVDDFNAEGGDIKAMWEMSRFSWALVLARAWRISGDTRYLSTLQLWIGDWWKHNPPNTGPNWVCGQESAIRLINTLLALRLAGCEESGGVALADFIEAHCRRIALTALYAVAQDNNHATSEAAGLFIGGTALARCSVEAKRRGQRWAQKGRRLLERSVSRLILTDGSFSQGSLTYHRLALDTLSLVETWRRSLGERPFTATFYARAEAATEWLRAFIDPQRGDGPNLEANDGTQPYRLHGGEYRDFRPCLQLASQVFDCERNLDPGPWDEPGGWLGITPRQTKRRGQDELTSKVYPDGGYVILRDNSGAVVLLRVPTARFRPSHADALHLDLWWKGENLLRDGGSYSYGDKESLGSSLASVVGHNVPQFDGHDQMPKLGRFLYGSWIRVKGNSAIATGADGEQGWSGMYTDARGAVHKRSVSLKGSVLRVIDELRGFKDRAILRWRLSNGEWFLHKTGCSSAKARIEIESTVPVARVSMQGGWESRHYFEKSSIPVLEKEIHKSPAVLTTTIQLF